MVTEHLSWVRPGWGAGMYSLIQGALVEEEIVPKAGSSEPMLAGQERLPRGNKDLTETCRMNWSQPVRSGQSMF